jgi:hypothetical protein
VISVVPTSAADPLCGAALNADAAGAVAAEGAGAFGHVLEQLMGAASPRGAAVDLPLADDDQLDEAQLDELANAGVVVDLGVLPINRLALAPAWALTDATATSVAVDAAVDSTVAERSVSAPTGMSLPLAEVDFPALPDGAPAAVAALMPDAGPADAARLPDGFTLPDVKSPTQEKDLADEMNLPSRSATSPAIAAGIEPAPTASSTAPILPARAMPGVPTPGPAATPTPSPAAAPTPEAAIVSTPETVAASTPEVVARELSAPPDAEARLAGQAGKAEKSDTADNRDQRHAFRVSAEAGHRAYAAAASEAGTKDGSRHAFSEARSDARSGAEPAAAESTAVTPFQVVVERPSLAVGARLAAPVVVSAEAIETAVATELPAQVVQSIRMQAIDGGGEAIIRLNPEYLGELVVAVKVEQGAVSAALQSDVPAVRKWVEANEGSLRQALAEQGLQLDRLTVSDDAPQAETAERNGRREEPREEESQPESRRQRKKAPDATFEVVV